MNSFKRPRCAGWSRLCRHRGWWLLAFCVGIILRGTAHGQGCMAVRGSGHCAISDHPWSAAEGILDEDRLHLSLGYRWFEADRHFSGSQELQIDPADRAVNSSHFLDISIGYAVTPRFGLVVTTPFVRSSRTTRYEHDRRTRRTTHAAGLGDLRLMAYYRLLDGLQEFVHRHPDALTEPQPPPTRNG